MSDNNISQELQLLGSPSSQELDQEIRENQSAHQNLLDYSRTKDTLILPNSEIRMTSSSHEEEQSYYWNEEEIKLLDQHALYHAKMIEVIEQAKTTGPLKKLPSPPKRKLKDLFNEKLGKKNKNEMTPRDFHLYLQERIQDMRCEISREKFQFSNPDNFDSAVFQLKDAYKHLSRQNAQSMYFNICFGKYLDDFYNWFSNEKKAGRIIMKWDAWLTSHISISSSYSRKLRQIAKLLIDYPRFQHVNITLNEVLNKQTLIKQMLAVPEYATFWKELYCMPLKTQQSQ